MRTRNTAFALGLVAAAAITAGWFITSPLPAQQPRKVDEATIRNAGKTGEEWLSYNLTAGETRYSPLKLIDTTNVGRLAQAWSYEIDFGGGGTQESTPIFHDGVLYSITNWSK